MNAFLFWSWVTYLRWYCIQLDTIISTVSANMHVTCFLTNSQFTRTHYLSHWENSCCLARPKCLLKTNNCFRWVMIYIFLGQYDYFPSNLIRILKTTTIHWWILISCFGDKKARIEVGVEYLNFCNWLKKNCQPQNTLLNFTQSLFKAKHWQKDLLIFNKLVVLSSVSLCSCPKKLYLSA